MKKIIALLLICATAFALTACSLFGDKTTGTTDGSATIEDYNTAISNTTPTVVNVTTTYENTAPEAVLVGNYVVTYNVDGTATIAYSFDRLAPIGSSEMMEKVEGTAELLANGSVSSADISETVAAAAVAKFNLDEKKMSYNISMGVLEATVAAENTASVFGVDLGSEAKLLMRITNDGKIGSYSISYSTSAGSADIVCIFS